MTLTLYVPASVGVPEMAPVLDDRVNPGGRLPLGRYSMGAGATPCGATETNSPKYGAPMMPTVLVGAESWNVQPDLI